MLIPRKKALPPLLPPPWPAESMPCGASRREGAGFTFPVPVSPQRRTPAGILALSLAYLSGSLSRSTTSINSSLASSSPAMSSKQTLVATLFFCTLCDFPPRFLSTFRIKRSITGSKGTQTQNRVDINVENTDIKPGSTTPYCTFFLSRRVVKDSVWTGSIFVQVWIRLTRRSISAGASFVVEDSFDRRSSHIPWL